MPKSHNPRGFNQFNHRVSSDYYKARAHRLKVENARLRRVLARYSKRLLIESSKDLSIRTSREL